MCFCIKVGISVQLQILYLYAFKYIWRNKTYYAAHLHLQLNVMLFLKYGFEALRENVMLVF